MKLSELFAKKCPTMSFEVFPPKTSDLYASVEHAISEIALLRPDFMSVTYGAGGGTSDYTVKIASEIHNGHGVAPLAHLTCISSTRGHVKNQLQRLKEQGIENIMALRGDIPDDFPKDAVLDYRHAADLIQDIKAHGNFCIGGACYPEGHVESETMQEDIAHLKLKVEAGCDFLVTQMFFDNNILYNYLYRLREAGITVPVVAGIMPVTNGKQIDRICRLSGTYLPRRFKAIVDKFGSDPKAMAQAGVAYATEQIIDLLANGVNNVHVYTMNKPEIAANIQRSLSNLIPSIKEQA